MLTAIAATRRNAVGDLSQGPFTRQHTQGLHRRPGLAPRPFSAEPQKKARKTDGVLFLRDALTLARVHIRVHTCARTLMSPSCEWLRDKQDNN